LILSLDFASEKAKISSSVSGYLNNEKYKIGLSSVNSFCLKIPIFKVTL
jgi:hypothetical protein